MADIHAVKLEELLTRYRRALACLPEDVPVGRLTRVRTERGWARLLDHRPEHRSWRSGAVEGYIFESLSFVLVGGGVLAHAVTPREATPAAGCLAELGIHVEGSTLRQALAELPPLAAVDYVVWYRHESCRAHGALRFRSDDLTVFTQNPSPLPAPPRRAS